MKKSHLMDLIVCPECKGKLEVLPEGGKVKCFKCPSEFLIEDDTPVLLTEESKKDIDRFWQGRYRNSAVGKRTGRGIFRQANHIKLCNKIKVKSINKAYSLTSKKTEKPDILIIGTFMPLKKSAPLAEVNLKKKFDEAIRLDIVKKEKTSLIGDGHRLPFPDRCFDLVIAQAVIKHSNNPIKFIAETHRVLKEGGYLYMEVAYLLPYHIWPADYIRYTPSGVKELLKDFEIVESSFIRGPSQTVADILSIYVASLLSFNRQFLFSLQVKVFSWLLHPIKYLDYLFIGNKWVNLLSQVNYYIARKTPLT